jgi:hypothetical protein
MASGTSQGGAGPARNGYRAAPTGYLDALLSAAQEREPTGARQVRAPYRPAWRPDVEPLTVHDYWTRQSAGEPATSGRAVRAATSPRQAGQDHSQDAASRAQEIPQSTASASPAPAGQRLGPPPAAPAPSAPTVARSVSARLSRPTPGGQPYTPLAGTPDRARPQDLDLSITSRSGPARPQGPVGPPATAKAATSPAPRPRTSADVDPDPAKAPVPTQVRPVLPERPAAAAAPPGTALAAAAWPAMAGSPVASVPSVHIGVIEVRVLIPAPPTPPAAPRPATAAQAGRGSGRPVRFFGLAQG